jgi:prenyltransferase beta subunit
MLSSGIKRAIKRLFVLGVFSTSLYVFGWSDLARPVLAAPCVQECETNQGSCNSDCQSACEADSTDSACRSCILSCNTQFLSCLNNAVWCDNEVSQPGRCTVDWVPHCPVINGVPNCSHPDAHYGYALTCTEMGHQCVACPDHHYCTGSGGLPGC